VIVLVSRQALGSWALVNHPLVGSYPAAAKLVDRLVEAHRAYLPAFTSS
jgi:alpha-galactosidase/6-phospho-beta-glucosidase family protein